MEPITLWVVIGVTLLIVEVLSVSFYAIFFGIGALITALTTAMGLTDNLTSQLIIFAISSSASLFIFRKKLLDVFNKRTGEYKEIVDDFANVSHEIPANGEGKVFYRGSDWIAYTKTHESIKRNTRVKIVKIDGIKLEVLAV